MLRRISLITILLFAFGYLAVAQQSSSAAPQDNTKNDAQKQDKKGKKKDKKDKKDTKNEDVRDAAVFSDAVATDVLGQIRDGLEGHSQRLLLSAFNDNEFEGYLIFEDQIQQYFEKYEGFRAHFRIIQTSIEGAKGVVLAEFDVEGMPRSGGAAMRRSNQLRFELERGKKGWKVVDMRPRGFFS